MSGILSIAQERFSLAAGESKKFENERTGLNQVGVEAISDVQPYMNMTGSAPEPVPASASDVVVENLADDGVTVVGSAPLSLSVVYRGRNQGTAQVGKKWQIRNVGPGYIHIVAKPAHQVQPIVSL